jgi:hypothetical protein
MAAHQADGVVHRNAVVVASAALRAILLKILGVPPAVVVHAEKEGFLERIPLDALDHLCSFDLLEAGPSKR